MINRVLKLMEDQSITAIFTTNWKLCQRKIIIQVLVTFYDSLPDVCFYLEL